MKGHAGVVLKGCLHLTGGLWEMSYGAPCERGVGAADMMPLWDMEVPGLIPDVSKVELAPKEARQGRQCDQRQ